MQTLLAALLLIFINGAVFAESITVRIRGTYPIKSAWIAAYNGETIEILPGTAVARESRTDVIANSGTLKQGADSGIFAAAFAISEHGDVLSTSFDRLGTSSTEFIAAQQATLVRHRVSALKGESSELQAAIELEKSRLRLAADQSASPVAKPSGAAQALELEVSKGKENQ